MQAGGSKSISIYHQSTLKKPLNLCKLSIKCQSILIQNPAVAELRYP